ncbi:protease inhibitor I42 family protein [Niabella sp.]|uniref:protease inhibitor I42 family protein n=1 Tax=Niabella sp. TaxID=1962976 RepID=UPI0026074E0D|nr:protease inhibitor I42 family protein [Niabella sp.]
MEKKITLKVNEVFQLQLDSLGGAGYSWVVTENNEAVTEVIVGTAGDNAAAKKLPPGAAVTLNVAIRGLKPGSSRITIVQKRVWETDKAPADTCRITVVVAGK